MVEKQKTLGGNTGQWQGIANQLSYGNRQWAAQYATAPSKMEGGFSSEKQSWGWVIAVDGMGVAQWNSIIFRVKIIG